MSLSAFVLAASLCAAGAPVKLAEPGFSTVNVDKELARFLAEHLAQKLGDAGVKVTTEREIATLLGFERQKQLLGCSDASSSCMAELANALGVDGLLVGDLALLEGTYQVNLKVISPTDGARLAATSFEASGQKELLGRMANAARALAAQLQQTPVPAAGDASASSAAGVEAARESAHPLRAKAWIPAAVGAVALAAGGVAFFSSNQAHAKLTSGGGTIGFSEAEQLRSAGWRDQNLGVVACSVAGAAAAAAVTMYLLPGGADAEPGAVAVAPGPGSLTVTVRLSL